MPDLTEDMFDNESVDTFDDRDVKKPECYSELTWRHDLYISEQRQYSHGRSKTDNSQTIMNSSTNLNMDEPTTIILLAVYNHKDYLEKKVEIKLRMNTSFGKLATLLRSKFDQTEKHVLRYQYKLRGKYTAYEWRIIFESDTPASLNLEDRAQLRFEVTQDEILDASNML
ncbi:hypothetical protein D6D19_07266 [Aureobasidium pullulans]|uniref:Uncharacterized protein n=1 Tax=Aureobasidium pullulans TaxID=5580 RepID=A0A4S8ZYJ4_AURPU|nr:hypothetical protein D6D19_07266 [Aureobasidium pullulans]